MAGTPEPVAEGTSPEPVAAVTSPEPVAAVTSPEPVAAVTSPEPVAAITSPESVAAITSPEPVAAVTSPEPVAAVTSPEPVAAITSPESVAAITSPEPVAVVTAPEQVIAVDDPHNNENDADNDSSLGIDEDGALSTASLTDSILEYRKENGRTYHSFKDGKYNMPNDEIEKDRLDLQHHLFLLTFDGKLGLCPANEPDAKVHRVLDVGTGTGIWAIDYADEHQASQVLGVDLSVIQPNFVPPNLTFEVDDLEETWEYHHPFDYIHSRMMTSSFADWKAYLQKCYDNLAPGGWMELQDVGPFPDSDDGTLRPEHALYKWAQLLSEACQKLGRPYQDVTTYKDLMRDIGFTNILETKVKWPVNTWPRDRKFKILGAWSYQNISGGIEGFSMAPFTRALGWTKTEVDMFLVEVRRDMKDKSIHSYFPVYSVYGQKPE